MQDIETLRAYLPIDRRYAVSYGEQLPEQTSGAALLADISGFTPLTETLTQRLGPQRGTEEITAMINRIYDGLIDIVHRFGGSVVTFSGDAITCWFAAEAGDAPALALLCAALTALACAFAMQHLMGSFRTIAEPYGATAQLSVKIAVVCGSIRRFLVGNPAFQRIDVLGGSTLLMLAELQHHAAAGEILLDAATAERLGDQLVIAGRQISQQGHHPYVIVGALRVEVAPQPWPPLPQQLSAEQCRPWLLPPVYERLQSLPDSFLAELRPAVALMLQFSGFDYDADPQVGDWLDQFICWVQQVVSHYHGTLIDLTIGDRGSYLYAAWGAPQAHDDDAAHAVAAACHLLDPAEAVPMPLDIRIGLARGVMRAGAYGSTQRHTYGVLGDATNLAFRLMSNAAPQSILCDYGVYETAAHRWDFTALPPIRVKGKASPVRVYSPCAQYPLYMRQPTHGLLVGRRPEQDALAEGLSAALRGACRVIVLEGEAGIGKTRLLGALADMVRGAGLTGLLSSGSSIELDTPYFVWRDVFVSYFGLEELADLAERRARVRTVLASAAPGMGAQLPLLERLLGLADGAAPPGDARLQRDQLQQLLVDLLCAWAEEQPLVLALEDAHWIDASSWELIQQLARVFASRQLPLLLVLATRPPHESALDQAQRDALLALPHAQLMPLAPLTLAETGALAADQLQIAPDDLPDDLTRFLQARTDGNPLFLVELIAMLREQFFIDIVCEPDADAGRLRHIVRHQLARAADLLPATMHGLMLARIDWLTPDQQLILKVAAVIGQVFDFDLLRAVILQHDLFDVYMLPVHLQRLVQLRFIEPESYGACASYRFHHSLGQAAAYSTLLFAQRRALHGSIAAWYEQNGAQASLLAYHYRYAEEPAHERRYAYQAGVEAAAQYANQSALSFLTRALELAPAQDIVARYQALLAREPIYDLLADRPAQQQDLLELSACADQLDQPHLRGQVRLRWASYAEVLSDFMHAAAAASDVLDLVDGLGRADLETEALLLLGRVRLLQGRLQAAGDHAAQALQLARVARLCAGEIQSLLLQHRIACERQDYPGATGAIAHALALADAGNDQRQRMLILIELGRLAFQKGSTDSFLQHMQQAATIAQSIGDRRAECVALGNLGTSAWDQGNYELCLDYYARCQRICQEIGDQHTLCTLWGNTGLAYLYLGAFDRAEELFSQSLCLQCALGDRSAMICTLAFMGLLFHYLNYHAIAMVYCQRALCIAEESGILRGCDFALLFLGHAHERAGQLPEARAAYERALELRQNGCEPSLQLEPIAGLARVALAQCDLPCAQAHVDALLAALDAGAIAGIEEPFLLYLTCYRVLKAQRNPQARHVLKTAHRLLRCRATAIRNPELRHSFLRNVPHQSALLRAFATPVQVRARGAALRRQHARRGNSASTPQHPRIR